MSTATLPAIKPIPFIFCPDSAIFYYPAKEGKIKVVAITWREQNILGRTLDSVSVPIYLSVEEARKGWTNNVRSVFRCHNFSLAVFNQLSAVAKHAIGEFLAREHHNDIWRVMDLSALYGITDESFLVGVDRGQIDCDREDKSDADAALDGDDQ